MQVPMAVGLLSAILLAGSTRAAACALDQVPSVSADGQLARLNRQVPTTQAQLDGWTWCVFPHAYAVGRAVVLTEDRRDVARTLMRSALRTPWGWDFGDGQIGSGYTVRRGALPRAANGGGGH
jgi:hypothetical protein